MIPGKHSHDDQLVVAYLLGTAPHDETERLDELSIADNEFASRLVAAENDLVDAYVRGDLSGEMLQRFQSVYLASPKRRQKVAFAESLASRTGAREPTFSGPNRRIARFPQWALAAAACLAMIAGGLGLYRYSQPAAHTSAEQRPEARALPPESATPPVRAPRTTVVPALVLPPQTRGAGSIATLKLPLDADEVLFDLELETDDFAGYRAALRNSATNLVEWRSATLQSKQRGAVRLVSVTVPSKSLEQRNYVLELSGIAAGAQEFVASYAFRVER